MNVSRRTGLSVLIVGLIVGWVRAEDKKEGVNATGTWESAYKTPGGGTSKFTHKFKQEGEKLTGTSKRPTGPERKVEKGMVKDGRISFQITEDFGSTVQFEGELKSDSIKGKITILDNSAPWEAKRQKDK
jgi:hypothetical protein